MQPFSLFQWMRLIPRLGGCMLALVVPVIFVTGWNYAYHHHDFPSVLIPSPAMVWQALLELVRNGDLKKHVSASARLLSIGFAFASIVGITVGTLVGCSRLATKVLEPTIILLAPIPAIAWTPFCIAFFGINDGSQVAIIYIGVVFVITFSVIQGIRGVEREYVELARVFGKRGLSLLTGVLWPSALPNVFGGMRLGMVFAWSLLIVSEQWASVGVGWLLWDSRNNSRSAEMCADIIVIGACGGLSGLFLYVLERLLTGWRMTYGTWLNDVETFTYQRKEKGIPRS